MANRIKGITVDIGLDSKNLSDGLSKVNKSIKDTKTNLKDVNKLLKLDPGNADLLKQKQELLNKAVTDTEEKLNKEKEALEALKQAGDSDENVEQQKALEREIVETENALKKAKEEAKDFGSVFQQQLKATGEQLKETGQKVTEVGESLSKNVTAPIVAVGTASVVAFNEVDSGLDIIVQKTGATGDALEDMEGIAKNIATTIPVGFETIGNAVGEVNTRFGLAGDDLEDLSQKFIYFSEVNGTDVVSSIDSVQKAMTAFGMDASEAGELLDVMNKVGQNTGVSMETLQSGLVSNATAFQELGLSAEESVVLMGQFEMSGADVNTAMGGLSKALKSATADGKPLEKALEELNDAIMNGTDSTDGLTMAYDLFGKSGAQVYQAVRSGAMDFSNLSEVVDESGDSVINTFEGMHDPIDDLTIVMNQLKILGAEIGSAIMPLIQQAIEAVTPVIEGLIEKWNNLSPEMQNFIVKVALVVASIGPLVAIIGKVITLFGTVMTVASSLGSVLALLTSPVGIVVAAIAGLIAIGVALYKNWDTIKQKASQLWSSITTTFENIRQSISDKINSAKEAVSSAIEKIKGFFNFNWSLPSLKLPHFSIVGEFSLKNMTVPHLSVDWYKNAYDNPVMFTQPTVLATAGGLKGFGDGNGAEIVMSMNNLAKMVGANNNAPIINMNVYGAQGQSVERLADEIEKKLANKINDRRLVYGK